MKTNHFNIIKTVFDQNDFIQVEHIITAIEYLPDERIVNENALQGTEFDKGYRKAIKDVIKKLQPFSNKIIEKE